MSEQLTIDQGKDKLEQKEVDIRFAQIVSDIENAAQNLPGDEIDKMRSTPLMKDPGSMDQGYRHG